MLESKYNRLISEAKSRARTVNNYLNTGRLSQSDYYDFKKSQYLLIKQQFALRDSLKAVEKIWLHFDIRCECILESYLLKLIHVYFHNDIPYASKKSKTTDKITYYRDYINYNSDISIFNKRGLIHSETLQDWYIMDNVN